MIPVLHSIDNLFNRFDELSKCHVNLLSNFDKNFPDVENPLRDVSRDDEEQRKTNTNILLVIKENDDQIESIKTIEDFNRRIIKNRYLHRPPSYSSNDSSLFYRIPSRTSSIMTESTLLPRNSQTTTKVNTSERLIPTSNNNIIIESKVKLTTKVKPQRYVRNTVTEFTMETVNRLSKPKIYHQSSDKNLTIKHVQRRVKPYENIKKEGSKCSTSSSILSSVKRTKTTPIKPSSKKVKVENRILKQTSKEMPVNNYSPPFVFLAPAPTICLSFPQEPQQKSSRIVIMPKTTMTNKRSKYTK